MTELRFSDRQAHVDIFVQAAMEASDPAKALSSNWPTMLSEVDSFYVVGFGKASLGMAMELEKLCGDRLKGGAVAVTPERLARLENKPRRFTTYPAAHPLPDGRNIIAAHAIKEVAEKAGEGDMVIALISGGGSAHLTLPAEGVELNDLRTITEALQHAGAPITALNTVRKHCEILKGGGLAMLAHPARMWAFILSDVVGDSLNVISSGPTAPDPTTAEDALKVLKYYNIMDTVPPITAYLQSRAEKGETNVLRPGDERMVSIRNTLIGSNRLALGAARRSAKAAGWRVVGYESGVDGEARLIGLSLGLRTMDMAKRPDRPCCLLLGGETTVTVHGEGRGGRNQELALAAALTIDGVENIVIASFATDGIEGSTNAAGAIVTGETCARARALGLDPQKYLNDNDAFTFFKEVGGLIRLGPTGTNVNDIILALAY